MQELLSAENDKSYQERLEAKKTEPRAEVHSFHRYFGKFIPAIPSFAIETFTSPGDTVLDTFCGSGTSIVEAKFHNRNAIGIDINPISCLLTRIKTTYIPEQEILDELPRVVAKINSNRNKSDLVEPYCVNIDHWFCPRVKQDLLVLKDAILGIHEPQLRDFYIGVFSAFMRNVSNCDPRHVFPGYSKRLRQLDAEGKRVINVFSSFERAVKKRAKQVSNIPQNSSVIKLYNCSAKEIPVPDESMKLVVINPPYISSIRYLETMKIEMGWLGMVKSQDEYLELDKKLFGTERFYKKDLERFECCDIPKLKQQVNTLRESYPKMAKVVSEYFINMKQSFSEIVRVLKRDGTLVIKISDSRVRTELILTHEYFIAMLTSLGMTLVDKFQDNFDNNSRSLLTTRNSYSDIMLSDWILIFKK